MKKCGIQMTLAVMVIGLSQPVLAGKQELVTAFYRPDNFITVKVWMPSASWNVLRNADPKGGNCNFEYTGSRYDWYQATSVTISGSTTPAQTTYNGVGIRKKSFCGSFSKSRPSLKLKFDKYTNNEWAVEHLIGTKHLTLNNSKQDPDLIRQCVGYKFFEILTAVPSSRCNFARVYVNNQDLGIYVNVEPLKKRFIKHNFKDNDEGNLYELEHGEDFIQSMLNRIDFKGFSSHHQKKDLQYAINRIKIGTSTSGVPSSVFDVQQFMTFWAMEVMLKHWDGYSGNLNNSYVYNDVKAVYNPTSSKVNFKFIPWGMDQILQSSRAMSVYNTTVLTRRLLANQAQRETFLDIILFLSNTLFADHWFKTVTEPHIDLMVKTLKDHGKVNANSADVKLQLQRARFFAQALIGEASAKIVGKGTKQCMHASSFYKVGSGKEVYRHACSSSRSDRWYLKPSSTSPGNYRVVNKKYGTCLFASNAYKTKSGHLNIYHRSCCSSLGAQWELLPRSGGQYQLKSKQSGKCLFFSNPFSLRSWSMAGNSSTSKSPSGTLGKSTYNNVTQIYQGSCTKQSSNLVNLDK